MDKKRKLHLLAAVILAAALLFCFWPRSFGHFIDLDEVQEIQVHLTPALLSEAKESFDFSITPEDPAFDGIADRLSHSWYYIFPITKTPNRLNFPLDYMATLRFVTGKDEIVQMWYQGGPQVLFYPVAAPMGTVRCYNSKALQQGLQALLLESAPASTSQ